MSDQLVPVAEFGVSKYAEEKTFSELASSSSFLPRLQLFGSNSDAAKEGKIGIGHYAIVNNKELEDLTKEVQVIVFSWRPLALDIKGDTVLSVFNPKSDEFKRIQGDSEKPDSGCMYGPQFLLYIPSVQKFVTFFMGSKTMRRAAGDLRALIGKAATLKQQLIKNKSYSWIGPVITTCSAPLTAPSLEEYREIVNNFNNPKESDVEKVEETTQGEERPR